MTREDAIEMKKVCTTATSCDNCKGNTCPYKTVCTDITRPPKIYVPCDVKDKDIQLIIDYFGERFDKYFVS